MKRGAAFEDYTATLASYAGIILVKVPTPVQVTSRPHDRVIRGRLEARVWVDFFGVLPGGRALAIEVKTTSNEDRFAMDDRLQGHQGEILRKVAAQGGVALVVVRRMRGADYCFPWTRDGAPFEGKSVRWDAAEDWRGSWVDYVLTLTAGDCAPF